ncbi:MAG: glycoside hydrolase family 3 C-terminal domain-containing protein [Bacilli bacterium]|nr:glycoside hydrolase family 3 C-terminal domain-containing protein [Bacilli bacterium]
MKKPTKKTGIIVSSIGGVLSAVMIAGTIVAYSYQGLLDVTFQSSDYVASVGEKELCKNVAGEGAVLLKNEDEALPLQSNETKLALIGQDSVDFVYGGSGSGSVDTATAPTLKSALEGAGYTINQTLWDFYDTGAGKDYRKKTPDMSGHGSFEVNEVPQSVYTTAVKESLKNDDVGVVVIGRSGGESADLPTSELSTGSYYLQIDQNEKDMLKMACDNFDKVIAIINANNPMELDFLEDETYKNVKAAFWLGGVGQEGMHAIPEILNGTTNPSGRLVDTYAYDSTSAPSFKNLGDYTINNSTVTNGNKYLVYGEGIYVGYKYYETRYEDVVLGNTSGYDYSNAVQFPFGYGLSYTTFEWSDFNVTEKEDAYEVTVKVKNKGNHDGKDVVEIYAQKPYTAGGVENASVELVGFAKTGVLKAGNSEIVKVEVKKKDLVSYDYKTNKTYIINKGDHYLSAGRNAHEALNNILALKGKTTNDGMTQDGDKKFAKMIFNQAEIDATTYSKSEVTGNAITNQFGDVDVNYYEDFTYLSRNDWTGTFPTTFKNGSWTATDKMLADLEFFDVTSDTTDDETINAFTYKSDSKDTTYKLPDVMELPYDDTKWDDLISQMTYTQMTKLIRLGGYATVQVDRIGLPKTIDKDGPSGISGTLVGGESTMAWPAEVVMASTWNAPMIQNLGVWFGEDSIAAGVVGVYGPGADIHRSPYSGRNFEYFSEDSMLSYQMAAHELRGLRSKGVLAYVKHFALNDQETNRYGSAIFANEQAIREIFFKGFEGAIVDGGANAAMAAMNRMGARWVGAHRGAMTKVLRDEWGFEGFVITDQASVPAMFYQDMISGLWAGCDMWLNTNESYWALSAYKEDKTMQYYITRSAKNIVYAIAHTWAVNDAYKTNTDGTVSETTSKIFPWKTLLWIVDCIIWVGAIGSSAFIWISYKKKPE